MNVMFIHKRSDVPGAKPLLLTHGWPGSVFEFHKVLEPLARDFDVIAPSMPGYGFSEAPAAPGFSVVEVARTNHALMQQLGYARYYAQGGDWGSVVTRCLGVLYPDHCQAIHLNMPVAGPPDATTSELRAPSQPQPLHANTDFPPLLLQCLVNLPHSAHPQLARAAAISIILYASLVLSRVFLSSS